LKKLWKVFVERGPGETTFLGPIRTKDPSFTVPNVVVVAVVVVFVDEKPCDIRVAVHGYDHVSVHDRDHDHVATECKAGLIGPYFWRVAGGRVVRSTGISVPPVE
jgi:hypothetical protein